MSDYAPIPLDRLIGTVLGIVAGEVVEVKDRTFTLRVTNTLAGGAPLIAGRSPSVSPQPIRRRRAHPLPTWTIVPSIPFPGREAGSSRLENPRPWRRRRNANRRRFRVLPGSHRRPASFVSYRVHGVDRKMQRVEAKTFCDAIAGYRNVLPMEAGKRRADPAGQAVRPGRAGPVRGCIGHSSISRPAHPHTIETVTRKLRNSEDR
jgi:hypothetical protein